MVNKKGSGIADPRSSDGVSLLISILVRFPLVGTVQFDSKQRRISLNFMLSHTLPPEELESCRQDIMACIKAYHFVTGKKPSHVDIRTQHPYDKFCLLTVERDLGSISKGEITLLSTVLDQKFHDHLILDDSEYIPDFVDDLEFPDDLIDNMFETVRAQKSARNLTALRENGRVLVFSK